MWEAGQKTQMFFAHLRKDSNVQAMGVKREYGTIETRLDKSAEIAEDAWAKIWKHYWQHVPPTWTAFEREYKRGLDSLRCPHKSKPIKALEVWTHSKGVGKKNNWNLGWYASC